MKKISLSLQILIILLLSCSTNSLASGFRLDAQIQQHLETHNEVPVIITMKESGPSKGFSDRAKLMNQLSVSSRVIRQYALTPSFSAVIAASDMEKITSNDAVLQLTYDAPIGKLDMLETNQVVNITPLHGSNILGSGQKIVIIDSGVDSTHPDLQGRVVAEACYCSNNCCPDGSKTQSGPGAAMDDNGHGTNTAGIAVSNGVVSADGGAPLAQIVAIKVADSGTHWQRSDLAAALEHVVNDHFDARAISMSMSETTPFLNQCDGLSLPTAKAASILRDSMLLFASSSNNVDKARIRFPGCLSDVVALAATWDFTQNTPFDTFYGCTEPSIIPDQIACYANSNALVELVAPGGILTMPKLGGGTIDRWGTSAAPPIVSSCVALIYDAVGLNPLSPDLVLEALKGSPVVLVDSGNGLAFPRMDCQAALDWVQNDEADLQVNTSITGSQVKLDMINQGARDSEASFHFKITSNAWDLSLTPLQPIPAECATITPPPHIGSWIEYQCSFDSMRVEEIQTIEWSACFEYNSPSTLNIEADVVSSFVPGQQGLQRPDPDLGNNVSFSQSLISSSCIIQ